MTKKIKNKFSIIALTICLIFMPMLLIFQAEAAGEWNYGKVYTGYIGGYGFHEQHSWRILSQSGDTAKVEIRVTGWTDHPNGDVWTGHTLIYENNQRIGKITVPTDYHHWWGKESYSTTVTFKGYGNHHVVIKNEEFNNTTVTESNMEFDIYIPKPKYTINFIGDEGIERIVGGGTFESGYNAPVTYYIKPGYVLVNSSGTCWDSNNTCTWSDGSGSTKSYSTSFGVTRNRTIYVHTKKNVMTNYVKHFAWGFKHNEGAHGGYATLLSETSFDQTIGSTYSLSKNMGVRVPNGYVMKHNYGTDDIDGTWREYPYGTAIVQNSTPMYFEFDYEPNIYRIDYNLNGGQNVSSNPSTYTVLYGVSLASPSRFGYTFTGWVDGSGRKVTGINEGKNAQFSSAQHLYDELATRQVGNVSLTATWTPNQYTYDVYHKSTSGKLLNHEQITAYFDETKMITPLDFPGYYRASAQEVKWDQTHKDITLYYEPIEYSISYDLGGASDPGNKTTYTIETPTFTLKNPSKNGFNFAGWTGSNGDNPQTSVTVYTGTIGDKNYSANWGTTDYTYNIVYETKSGKTLGTDRVTGYYGQVKVLKAKDFSGYHTPNDQAVTWDVIGTKTIKFIYEPIEYKIVYNLNGGLNNANNITSYNIETPSFTIYNPSKHGFTFTGWTGANGTTPQANITINTGTIGDKTYNANWSNNGYVYDIVYESVSGKYLGGSNISGNIGDTKVVTPKDFNGYKTPQAQTVIWNSTNKKVIKFIYTPINYEITYDLNGGTNNGQNKDTFNIESPQITLKDPSKTGHSFTGWTGTNGSVPQKNVTINTGSTGNKNYTANWTKQSYTYNIIYKDGSTILGRDTVTHTFGETHVITPKDFPGYTTPPSQTVIWDSSTPKDIIFQYTHNVTLYAQWKFNDTPTTIIPLDEYYIVGQTVTGEDIKKTVIVNDDIDKNIKDKLVINKIIYEDGTIVNNPTMLDTSKAQSFTVEYSVTNSRDKTTTTTHDYKIILDRGELKPTDLFRVYNRYIANGKLGTLDKQSVWQLNMSILESLFSVNKADDKYPVIHDRFDNTK